MIEFFKEIGLGTTIWSPLACGLLTGKYTLDQIEKKKNLVMKLELVKMVLIVG